MAAPHEIPGPAVDRLYRWFSDQWRGERKPSKDQLTRALRRTFARLGAQAPEGPQPHSAPTQQLVRHKGAEPIVETRDYLLDSHGAELSAPRYRWEWAVDRMAVALSAEEYSAAERLRNAYLTRQNTPGAVDPNGAGGSHPGPRMPIRDPQLRAAAEWNAIWLRLPPDVRFIVRNFILEEAPRGLEHPIDAVEFGGRYGVTQDKAKARGVTVGALRATCAVVARLYHEYDDWKARQRRESPGAPRGVPVRRLSESELQLLVKWEHPRDESRRRRR